MIPKKASSLYQSVAEDLNLETKLVESFVEFYYKNLRQSMSVLSHTRLNVEGLGHFYVKANKIRKAISTYAKCVSKNEETTFNDYHNKKRMEQKLVLLNAMQNKISVDIQKKIKFKERKNEFKTDLERKTQDNGGN
jgi:nucleoid DNA-binding protein